MEKSERIDALLSLYASEICPPSVLIKDIQEQMQTKRLPFVFHHARMIACITVLSLVFVASTAVLQLIGSQAEDPMYNKTHKEFASYSEIENFYLPDLLTDNLEFEAADSANFIVNFDENSFSDISKWNWLSCTTITRKEQLEERLNVYIQFPNYINKDDFTPLSDHYLVQGKEITINGVLVKYSDFTGNKNWSLDGNYAEASFSYRGNIYIVNIDTQIADNAWEKLYMYLNQMLEDA